MGRRGVFFVFLIAAVLFAWLATHRIGGVRQLARGSVAPAAWTAAVADGQTGPFVVWLFRSRDCLTCESFDYEVRRVQLRYGQRVPLLAVLMGPASDTTIARRFLASRRLKAYLLRTTVRFSPAPLLLVVRRDRIVWLRSSLGGAELNAIGLDSSVTAALTAK